MVGHNQIAFDKKIGL